MGTDFKFIFESSPDIQVVLLPDTPNFTIAAVTDGLLKKTIMTREQLIGKHHFDVFPENPNENGADGMRNLRMSLDRVISTKAPDSMAVQRYDIRLPAGDGSYQERYWSPTNIPLIENGVLKYILHSVEDVTELVLNKNANKNTSTQEFKARIERMEADILARAKEIQLANEKLRDAVQLREDVLAIVSHDLNNPLGSIQMSAELLKDSLSEEDHKENLELIQIIERSVRHMKRLIDDLLSFAKIQSGNLDVEIKPTNFRKLLEEGINSIRHLAIKKRIHIKADIQISRNDVPCDHDRILEVLANILCNAIKFSPTGSLIVLTASEGHDEIRVSIRDEGKGILPEHIPHLFDRYWQAKETAKHGTGLGLAIAKGIITNHKGKIWVESTPGHGTTVHFSIPLNLPWAESADSAQNKHTN
ncbi:ATP-binding protein [Bdellovibrio bacteriovorus]|uniref:sensor histidine kinase n=1 Tax=Bdellovibrio TaxID=958 RepID=UPI0035A8C6AE